MELTRVLRNVVALEGKILLHGGDGDVHFFVVVGVVAAADFLTDADDGEIDSADGNGLANHGMSHKEEGRGFLRDKNNAASITDVFIIDKAAGSNGKVADNGVAGFVSAQMGRSVAPLADFVEVGASELGGDGADLGQGANGGFVAEREFIGAHAGVLVGDGGDGAVHGP